MDSDKDSLKSDSKNSSIVSFSYPKSSFGSHKVLTKDSIIPETRKSVNSKNDLKKFGRHTVDESFLTTFKWCEYSIWANILIERFVRPSKNLRLGTIKPRGKQHFREIAKPIVMNKKSHFQPSGNTVQIYAPQTKILEGGTKDEMRVFLVLFKCVSTRFGLRTIEKSI